jgi:hypothetical protein
MKKIHVLHVLLALGAIALAACTQTESGLAVQADKAASGYTVTVDSTVSFDTTYVRIPLDSVVNQGNSANDSCARGSLYKRHPQTGVWSLVAENGAWPHAQCSYNQAVITRKVAYTYDTLAVANKPPVAIASVASAVIECANYGGSAALNGSASYDEDGAIVSYQWIKAGVVVATGANAQVTLPLGSHSLTLVVTDNEGAKDSADVSVRIEDTTPPSVSLAVSPGELWSPNHKYVVIAVSARATDACASNPADLAVAGGAASNEPDNTKGDGNTSGDVKVTRSNGSVLLSSMTVPLVPFNALSDKLELRSERAGNLVSRVYTMTLGARDPSGNAAAATAKVTVPHNK